VCQNSDLRKIRGAGFRADYLLSLEKILILLIGIRLAGNGKRAIFILFSIYFDIILEVRRKDK